MGGTDLEIPHKRQRKSGRNAPSRRNASGGTRPRNGGVAPTGTTALRRILGPIRRIVVKVGSGVIADSGRLRARAVSDLAYDVSVLRHRGYEVLMVVSGAVAAGYSAIGFGAPPKSVVERQASASVGQHRLMALLATAFSRHRLHVAQLLMSAEDIENRRRFLSARHTLQMLIARGVVPIINENDALSDDEIKVGDNDHLAALVTSVASADLLVILSRVDGLRSNGGGGPVISEVAVDGDISAHVSTDISATGVGGMVAKVSAAQLASRWGVATIIANGTHQGALPRIVEGEPCGTIFLPRRRRLSERKRWIAIRSRTRGSIRVDPATERSLRAGRASLLPMGILAVDGDFLIGARVDLCGANGTPFAVGLVSYSAAEIRRLRGRPRDEIQRVLGYEYMKEIVHHDDLVLLHDARPRTTKEAVCNS